MTTTTLWGDNDATYHLPPRSAFCADDVVLLNCHFRFVLVVGGGESSKQRSRQKNHAGPAGRFRHPGNYLY